MSGLCGFPALPGRPSAVRAAVVAAGGEGNHVSATLEYPAMRYAEIALRSVLLSPAHRVRVTVRGRAGSQAAADARAIGSAGERLVHTEEVTGSIPVSPTSPARQPIAIVRLAFLISAP